MATFELKSCPFCGGYPHINTCADYAVIFCGCGIRSRENRKTADDLIRISELVDEWNNRLNLN